MLKFTVYTPTYNFQIAVKPMRPLSPIRSTSPINRPRITFNYPPSPLKEQHSNTQILIPQPKQLTPQMPNPVCESKVQKYLIDNDKCSLCTNTATHKSVKQGNRYCSKCMLLVVKKGVEVVRIELKQQKFQKQFQQKRDKENIYQRDKIKGSHQKYSNDPREKGHQQTYKESNYVNQNPQIQLENLLKESKEMQGFMQTLLVKLSDEGLAEQGIKKIYKQKKLGLKKHYELIKATIKLSIQKDLEELEQRQRKSMQCLQDVKRQLTHGIAEMSSVKHRIQNIFNEVSYSSDVSKLHNIVNQTQQSVKKAVAQKTKASQIVSQLTCAEGSESQGDSLHVRLTQQQLQQARRQLYDASTYTLLSGANRKGETLFSFESKIK